MNIKTAVLILLVLSILPFYSILDHEFVNYDDDKSIYNANALKQPDALKRIWVDNEVYGPHLLTYTLWYLEGKLFGLSEGSAKYFHGVSILMHAASVILLFFLLQRLGLDLTFALFAGAMFAVHPWRMEPVAWATSQKGLLSAIFSWMSWLLYLKGGKKGSAFSMLCYLLALLSKATSIGLPLLFLLGDRYRGSLIKKDDLKKLLCYLPVAALGGSVAFIVEGYFEAYVDYQKFTILEHAFIISKNILYYIINFPYPTTINLFYPKWDLTVNLPNLLVFITTFVIICSALFLGYKFKYKTLIFCLLGFFIISAPIIGFYRMPYFYVTFVADKYMYMPLIFLIIGLLESFRFLSDKYGNDRHIPKAWQIAAIVMIIAWSIKTANASAKWQNTKSLWKHVLSSPNMSNGSLTVANRHMGIYFKNTKNYGKALLHFKEAVKLDPSNSINRLNLGMLFYKTKNYNAAERELLYGKKLDSLNADLYFILGDIYIKKREYDKALLAYNNGSKPGSKYNNNIKVHINKAKIYIIKKQYNQATDELKIAMQIDADDYRIYFIKGNILYNQSLWKQSIKEYEKSTLLNSKHVESYLQIAKAYLNLGNFQKALKYFKDSTLLEPDNIVVLENLGLLLMMEGSNSESVDTFKHLLTLDPFNGKAHYNLGIMKWKLGNKQEAVDHINKAVRSYIGTIKENPQNAMAHNELGIALASLGKNKEAVNEFKSALKINPGLAEARKNLTLLSR